MVKNKPCHFCKSTDNPVEKVKCKIDLGHQTLVPLVMTELCCRICYEELDKFGITKVRNARIVLAK